MTYTKSCVLLIPESMQGIANAVIEGYGFGPSNLSVPVKKVADGSAWYGCHIWCNQEFIDFIQSQQQGKFSGKMIVSVTAGPASENWSSTLQAEGMEELAGQ